MSYMSKPGGIGMRAKQRMGQRSYNSFTFIQAELERSRNHWLEFRLSRGMARPTYTKADRQIMRAR
jgi:hypothetical protein